MQVLLYMVGCLWSFISVFASSLTAIIPLPWLQAGDPCDIYKTDVYGGGCITLYYWWCLSFAFCMAILLALDLREQATFQTTMTALRCATSRTLDLPGPRCPLCPLAHSAHSAHRPCVRALVRAAA